MQLEVLRQTGTRDDRLDTNISDLEILTLSSGSYLYTQSGPGGGLRAYRLSSDGSALVDVDTAYFDLGTSVSEISTLAQVQIDGSIEMVVGADGGVLSGYAIVSDGTLSTVGTTADVISTTSLITAVETVDLGSATALFVADGGRDQLTSYRALSGGSFSQSGTSFAIEGEGHLQTIEMGGQNLLFLADQSTAGLRSFEIDAGTGSLSLIGSLGPAQGYGWNTPTALETVTAFGETWMVLAAANSHSLSVMRVTSSGGLEPADHLVDTLATRFGSVQDIAIAQSGDRVFVIAAGGDDGLSLFTLLPEGQLLHLQTLEHETGRGLDDIRAVEAALTGDQLQVFIGGAANGITHLTLDVSSLGDTRENASTSAQALSGTGGDDLLIAGDVGRDTLSGGSGDDILLGQNADVRMTGGAGRDWFVLRSGNYIATITDFRPGTDVLDLSMLPMLRSLGQFSFEPTGSGARLSYLDIVVEIQSHNGASLTLSDIFAGSFSWADHYSIILPDGLFLEGGIGNDVLNGAARADTLIGSDGDDTLSGLDGNDQLRGDLGADLLNGNDGEDFLQGGQGNDTAIGGQGDDTILGGDGNDLLRGSEGDDVLFGEHGDDAIWSDAGRDELRGGSGNDTLGGGDDDDLLYADAGDDQAWGGAGNDHVFGGLGHDTLGGREGNDTLSGGDGNDQIWANSGNDLIWGGAQDDTLGGSHGNDTIHGETGQDDLRGANGNDSLMGGSGNDTMDASTGQDRAFGGEGDDLIYGGFGDDYLEGNNGDDRVWGGRGTDTVLGGNGDDLLGGAEGDDSLLGGDGNDEIWANSGDDTLFGGSGHDLMGGSSGRDVLYGESGNDTLRGGPGEDALWAGIGTDILSGGSQADTFHFFIDEGSATITDFENWDRIQIHSPGVSYESLVMRQSGRDTDIVFQGTEITLEDFSLTYLTEDHFLFV